MKQTGFMRFWLERALFAFGVICLGLSLVIVVEGYLYQALGRWELNHLRVETIGQERTIPATETPPVESVEAQPAVRNPEPGSLVGKITIPEVGIDTIILEGVDPQTLRRGAGRFPRSAMPGEKGNLALAAHRDTFFRGLRDIKEGQRIVVTLADGRQMIYRVESTEVVEPTRVDVVEDVGREALTLVTCYPFSYVGPAPKRFIVRGYPEPISRPKPDSPKPSKMPTSEPVWV